MTEANLYSAIFLALLAHPGELPPGDYPPGLQDAAIRFAVGSGMCGPGDSWWGWQVPATVAWCRQNLYVLGLPHESELERMPPQTVVLLMHDHNAKFAREIDFWWHATPFRRDFLRVVREENQRLTGAWELLAAAHLYAESKSPKVAREMLGQFRELYPEYYWAPSAIPACPYWRLRCD